MSNFVIEPFFHKKAKICKSVFNFLIKLLFIFFLSPLKKIVDCSNTQKYYKLTKTLKAHNNVIKGIAALKINKGILASYSSDNKIILWDEKSNFNKNIYLRGHTGKINDFTELSNGLLVSASSDSLVKIWDPNNNYRCVFNFSVEENESVTLIREFKNEYNDLFLISASFIGNLYVHKFIKESDNNKLSFSFYRQLTNATFEFQEKISNLLVLKSGFLVATNNIMIRIYDLNEDFKLVNEINLNNFEVKGPNKSEHLCGENNKHLCPKKNKNNEKEKENNKENNKQDYLKLKEKAEAENTENKNNKNQSTKSSKSNYHSILKTNQLKNGNIIVITNFFLYVFKNLTEMKPIHKAKFAAAYIGGGVYCQVSELESGLVAISSNDNTIKVFDPLKNFKQIFNLSTGSLSCITCLYELSSGLLAAATIKDFFIFNPNLNFEKVFEIKNLANQDFTAIAELNSGFLALSSRDENVYILDRFQNYSLLKTIIINENVTILSYLEIKSKSSKKYFGCLLLINKSSFMVYKPNENFKLMEAQEITDFSAYLIAVTELNSGLIVSCSEDRMIRIHDPEKGFKVLKSIEFSGVPRKVFETRDGKLLASGNDDVTIVLDARSDFAFESQIKGVEALELSKVYFKDEKNLTRIHDFASDGDYILSANKIFQFNDFPNVNKIKAENHIDNKRNNFSNFPNDHKNKTFTDRKIPSIVITIDREYSLLVQTKFKFQNYTFIEKFKIHDSYINEILELQDGNIASCSEDKSIKIWNLLFYENFTKVNLIAVNLIYDAHQASVDNIIQLKNGLLLTSSWDENLKFWDLNAFKTQNASEFVLNQKLNSYRTIYKLFEMSNGLVIFSEKNYLKILKNEFYENLKFQIKAAASAAVNSERKENVLLNMLNLQADKSATSFLFAATNADGNLKIFRLKSDLIYNSKISKFPFTKSTAIKNSENKLIALAGYDREILVLDVSYPLDAYVISTFNFHKNPIRELISIENKILISCGGDGFIALWDLVEFNLLYSFQASRNTVNSCVVLNEEDFIFAENKNYFGKNKDYKINDSDYDYAIENNKDYLNSNSKNFKITLAAVVDGNVINIWDIYFNYKNEEKQNSDEKFYANAKLIKTLEVEKGKIKSVLNLNSGGDFIVSTRDKFLYVYKKNKFEIKFKLEFQDDLNSVIYVKNNIIAVSFVNGIIKVLDFNSNNNSEENFVVKNYCCHSNRVVSIIYSADKYIISSSSDSLIYWNFSDDVYGNYIYLDSLT